MNKNLSIFISALVLILALLLIFSHLISSSKTLIVVESAHRSVSSLEVIGSNSDLNEKYIFEIINCLQKLSFVNQTAFHSKDFQLFIESLVRGKYYKMTKEFSVDTSHIWIDVALIETNKGTVNVEICTETESKSGLTVWAETDKIIISELANQLTTDGFSVIDKSGAEHHKIGLKSK